MNHSILVKSSRRSRLWMIVPLVIFLLMPILAGILLMTPPQGDRDIFDNENFNDPFDWGPNDDSPPNCPEQNIFREALNEYGREIDLAIDKVKSGSGQTDYMAEISTPINSTLNEIYRMNIGESINVKGYKVRGDKPYDDLAELYQLCYGEEI